MKHPPGLTRSDTDQTALAAALAAQAPGYVPRTHLMDGDAPRYTNRLIYETSPYLKQHAHNPVDWWAWGDDALNAAKEQSKPIFLSAGYATCHWCHVMEEESFDNEAVAALLNTGFIPIKLDREERPDVDQTFILATQFQNGHAGWPNSIWALPDGRPFHTGTYFQRGHFMQILDTITKAWDSDKRSEFEQFADRLSTAIATAMARGQPESELRGVAGKAVAHLAEVHNPAHGGFSQGQQFPNEVNHLFLLDQARRGNKTAREVTLHSLDQIAAGGLHDHLGGGFHRYTVDVNWRTPHFEKMLYNQALLMRCYTEAWSLTGNPLYARAVGRCAEYMKRDMTAPDGAFFAAEDADSLDDEGRREEGAFYAWTMDKAKVLVTTGDARLLGIDQEPTIPAGSVPHLVPRPIENADHLDQICDTLRVARELRPRPFRDEKVLMGWNGMMIASLAEAGLVFGQSNWCEMATGAFDAVTARLRSSGTWQKLQSGTAPDLTDLAFMGQAALAVFACTSDPEYVDLAVELAEAALSLQTKTGRFALSLDGPIGPVFELDDGAMPSGESATLSLLHALHIVDGNLRWSEAADRLTKALSGHIAAAPTSRPMALRAVEESLGGTTAPIQYLRNRSGVAVLTLEGAQLRLTQGHTATDFGENPTIPRPATSGLWTQEIEICSDKICYPKHTLAFCVP
ncbi:MAG: thioredoxin domain-containing protein [Pseudomonadota bacterium]